MEKEGKHIWQKTDEGSMFKNKTEPVVLCEEERERKNDMRRSL